MNALLVVGSVLGLLVVVAVALLARHARTAPGIVAELRDKTRVLDNAPDTERNRLDLMQVENLVNRPGVRRHVYTEIAKQKAGRAALAPPLDPAPAPATATDSCLAGDMGSVGFDIMGNEFTSINDPALSALGIFSNDVV